MTKSIASITAAIDSTIAARKQQLPAIEAESARVAAQLNSMRILRHQLADLMASCADEAVRGEVRMADDSFAESTSKLEGYQASLAELKAEFTRDTLNIGVSGAARTGKSTTLQRITGLTDRQIPSGGLNPVTAVRSEIYNSPRNEAVITPKTEVEFIEGYVRPHAENVNACLGKAEQLHISSMADLKAARIPEKLDGAVVVGATDSLKRLREAQRSASSYEGLLGKSPFTVALDDVRVYVTYPSAASEQREIPGGKPADRRYLAVKLAQVYCQFPNLGNAKVGLVDLPGLGEIGNSASKIHLKGLEDKVDQIFLVMRPTAAKAFADNEVACNLDQLQAIQPAVRRGDLVLAGINKDAEAGQVAADNLRSNFHAEINAGRGDGGYQIEDYCAVNEADVARVFGILLDRLGSLLPAMDRQKLEHCMGAIDLSGQIAEAAGQLVRAMDRVLRTIPSSDRVMKQRIDAIERNIVHTLNAYAVELASAANKKSDSYKSFVSDAQAIHDGVARHIEDGLFRSSKEEWSELTSGSRDYYNLYRDEDKRVRYEIIDAYCDLDRFYSTHVNNFKLRVLDILLRSCGMDGFFKFDDSASPNERIAAVRSELGSTLRDDDLDSALRLLADMRFDFRSNVFLRIEEHLEELANPSESCTLLSFGAKAYNKRKELGGAGSSEYKQSKLFAFLRHDATEANDAILKALKSEDDKFNKYLAVSIDFFNNYLFGKDEDNFKQVVIRGLIREYKSHVLPDADDASKSPLGQMARNIKENAISLRDGKNLAEVENGAIPVVSVSGNKGASERKRVDDFSKGQEFIGTVARVTDQGATVKVRNHYGFVPRGQISKRYVSNPADYVSKGDNVRVKVIDINRDRDKLILSMKQCG